MLTNVLRGTEDETRQPKLSENTSNAATEQRPQACTISHLSRSRSKDCHYFGLSHRICLRTALFFRGPVFQRVLVRLDDFTELFL